MHVHKPKPAHGLREFLSEIAIIVIGVLIAIGIEQAVEAWHWAHQVESARAALKREMSETDKFFVMRVATEQCREARVNELGRVVEMVARHEPAPIVRPFVMIGNAMNDSDWENYRASQVLTHFDQDERSKLGFYFFQFKNLYYFLTEEIAAQDVIETLIGDPSRLGPADVAALRVAIQRARRANALLAVISRDQIRIAREMGLPIPQPDAARLASACAPVTAGPAPAA